MELPEVVPFKEQKNGISIRRNGYKVGVSLVVGWASMRDQNHYKIFNIWTGEPAIPNRFADMDDCLRVADLIDKTYGEYWEINTVWPELNIISAAQWSIPSGDGIRLYLALSSLAHQDKINLTDVIEAWDKAKDKANEMIRRYVTT